MTETMVSEENIKKALEELRSAQELAERASLEIKQTLHDSRERTERIRADLRRAGLLRD